MMEQYSQVPPNQAQSLLTPINQRGLNAQQFAPQNSYTPPLNALNQQNVFVSQMASNLPQNNPPNTTYLPLWANNAIGQNQDSSQFQNSILRVPSQPIGTISNQQPFNVNLDGSPSRFGEPISNQQSPNQNMFVPLQPTSQLPGAEQSQLKDQFPQKPALEAQTELVPIKDAGTYLSSNIFHERIQGVDYRYFLAQKQNTSGIMYNTRFFVVDANEFSYSTQFNINELQIPFKSLSKFPEIKKRYKLQNITFETPKKEQMKIQIPVNPKEKVTWYLRALEKDANMMLQIYTLLHQAKASKELRMKATQLQSQNSESIKPMASNVATQNNNHQMNSYQSAQLQQSNGQMSMGQTGFASQNAQYLNQQAPFLQSGQQQFYQQSSDQQYSNPILGEPPAETQILKDTSKTMDSQIKSNQRYNLPTTNTGVPQSAVYQNFRRNFMNDVERRKKLLYTDNQNWNYQILKGDEQNVMINFKMFAEALVVDIIDDMNEPQSSYSPFEDLSETQSIITYKDYQGVEVRLCLTGVKEYKLLKQTKESVYDESAIRAAFREFNNMDYLMQLTRNKGKIRVPLAAIVEYKGIVAFVNSNIPVDNSRAPISLLKELELLSRQSRIKDTIFQDDKAVVIAPLQSKFYEKLAREENSSILRQPNAFDIYYLNKVKHFLPIDLQFTSKDPENYILRSEFIQRQQFFNTSFFGESLKKYLGKQKVPNQIQQCIRQLEQSEKLILKIANQFVKDLEQTDEIIVGSEDFTRLLHKRGLNIRYMGLIYSTAKIPFIRRACMAQIAARSAKSVLQYDLQSLIKNAMTSNKNNQADACSITDMMLDYAVDFLNSVTGNTQDSREIGTRINKQALYEFNVPIIKQDVAQGYFVVALLHHCNVKCSYRYDSGDKLFIRNIFERTKDTIFTVKSKVYSLKFTDLYKRIHAILLNQAEDSFEQLKSILNLKKSDIPQHLKLDNTFNELAVYLAGNIPPNYKDMIQDDLPCSSLYQMAKRQMPSLAGFQIALAEIKWDLKYNKVEDAIFKKDQLEQKITKWCGDVHPILIELYNVFAVYELNRYKYEEAVKYSKSSLANNSNLFGNNSLKSAESLYQLANVFLKASKREEALIYMRKAKNIYDNKDATDRLSYAQIEIKIAALDLQFDRFEEAEAFALHAITIFETVEGRQTELVQAYELISRVYEVTNRREQMAKTAQYCGQLLSEISEQSNLQRMIKIAILPLINDLPANLASKLSILIQSIPYQHNTSNPTNALNYLKGFISKKIFMDKIKLYINNLEDTIQFINDNALLARWRGLQNQIKTGEQEFIAIMESLVYLLGDGFISGALNDL